MARSKHYEHIKELHDRVERHGLFVDLLKGEMTLNRQGFWCFVKFKIYQKLDTLLNNKYPALALKKAKDFYTNMQECNSTFYKYSTSSNLSTYINSITIENVDALLYIHYFADLHGGQLIAKINPSLKTGYHFKQERKALLEELTPIVNSVETEQVKVEFENFAKLLDNLHDEFSAIK